MRSTLEVDWPLMQNGLDFTAITGAERTYDQVVAALDAQYGSASSNGDTGIEGARRDASISTRDAQYYASRDTSWASALNSSTSLGTSPWIVKERTSANSQAAYSTNRANAQAAHDAALLSAIDNWQTSNRSSTLSLLLAEGQSREAYNQATANVYANWEMGVGSLLRDKPAGTDWSALGYTGAEQPSGSVSSRKETGRYVQLAAWQDNKEGQAKNDKPAENGLPPRPTTVSVSLDDSIMKGDFDFTPDEFEEFQRQLLAGEIKLTDVPLMLEGMHPALIKFISENPEVYKELTRKYGFEYQHKLNALFKNNEVIVGYRGYFDRSYNIEAGRVYLDNGSWYFFTASAQTQADRLKDLIDRVGEIEGNDEVRSPILTPGDIASWFNPDRSVRNNLDYVEPEIEKIVKDLAWELAGEVIQEATGAKLAAAGGSAAIKGGTQAVAAASNSFAAFLQWRKYKRLGKLDAPNNVLNFANELAVDAQSARRHLRRNVPGTGGQAHHIIPFETRNHEIVQRAARGGFNMNGANNGIRLDLTQHLGSHPKYNAAVTKKLDELLRVNPNISDLDAARVLQQYVDQLRAGLEKSTSMLH